MARPISQPVWTFWRKIKSLLPARNWTNFCCQLTRSFVPKFYTDWTPNYRVTVFQSERSLFNNLWRSITTSNLHMFAYHAFFAINCGAREYRCSLIKLDSGSKQNVTFCKLRAMTSFRLKRPVLMQIHFPIKSGGGKGGYGTYVMASTISEILQIPLFMGLYDVDMANNKLLFWITGTQSHVRKKQLHNL
jgi:hypothetical protein